MSQILSNAFLHHQNFSVIKNEKRRQKILYYSFLYMNKIVNEYGEIYTVYQNNEPIGYVTFIPESDREQFSFKRIIKTKGLGDFIKFILYNTPFTLLHFIRYLKTYSAHVSDFDDKTIHLLCTGITPEKRGKGIMSKHWDTCFRYYREIGYTHVVLETSDESNLPIYQKKGFRLQEVIKKKQTIFFMKLEFD